ncbi:copper chaperone PCu(A)C [Tropicibacter alexandrii]|uniref:copper chaperone PCu(A)C n=1 Tax=Tropicibacter alexandrii TaxID=2267683 RepID=UPI000EF532DB|nr:copper chaperone PCu(A)C [Tropicibacter alexandrii]
MKKTFVFASAVALFAAMPAMADIVVKDAYARAANTMAGAAFMVIENTGPEDDQLIDARSDVAKRVELHTHKDMGDGIMKMMHVEEGFAIPAGGEHALMRGGDHVMFMGLNGPMEQGDMVTVTLVFEKAGEIAVEIPVDLERKQGHGMAGH